MLRIGYYTPSVMLTSELTNITILTDHESVEFSLSVNGFEVLSGRYYAHGNSITVCDIATLIENAIIDNRDSLLTPCNISVTAGDESDTHDFYVLYCNRGLGLFTSTDWLAQNFLTLSAFRRIAREGMIEVAWYAADRETISFRIDATFLNDKGVRNIYHYVQSGNGMVQHGAGVNREIVWVSDIVAKIKSVMKIDSLTLQSFTVRCGERSLTVFVDPGLSGIIPFYYVNCFNIVETLALQRVTIEKIKSDHSIASLGRTSCFYDVSTSKEYDVQTGPLTADECVQIEQLLTSPTVRIPWGDDAVLYDNDFDALSRILITDYTSELSDTAEKPNSVKFTWRFEDNRPQHNIKSSPGIFNENFNPTFS